MELTHKLLLDNGWEQLGTQGKEFLFECVENYEVVRRIEICCIEGFCSWLMINGLSYGEGFTTTEELQAIFKALFKFDLKFEDNESR